MNVRLKFYLFLSLLLIAIVPIWGQLPEVSTAENPQWYYLQVEGSGSNREGLAFTVTGSFITGDAINTSNQSVKDRQLFRFEKAGDGNYFIISKSANKRVDVANNTVVNEPGLGLSDDGVTFIIRQIPGTHYYNMEVTRIPSLGNSGTKYVHQANQGTPRAIILTTTTWYQGDNSQYAFVPEEQINLEYSTASNEVFYRIKSGQPNHQNICITDNSSEGDFNLVLQENIEKSDKQLWKLVQKPGARVDIINKETGNIIHTKSDIGDLFNKTIFTQDADESNGWAMKYHRAGQYIISGVEEDGITRYWTFTTVGATPQQYNEENLSFSGYTWKFEKVKTDMTAVTNPKDGKLIEVAVKDRRIFVNGYDDFSVRNIQGSILNKEIQLPVGIYLVTVEGQTVKVLVK